MKYAIYGAGRRGKWILELLGMEKTDFFVDGDMERAGTEYCGKPVINIGTFQKRQMDYICVVTPKEKRDEISETLPML